MLATCISIPSGLRTYKNPPRRIFGNSDFSTRYPNTNLGSFDFVFGQNHRQVRFPLSPGNMPAGSFPPAPKSVSSEKLPCQATQSFTGIAIKSIKRYNIHFAWSNFTLAGYSDKWSLVFRAARNFTSRSESLMTWGALQLVICSGDNTFRPCKYSIAVLCVPRIYLLKHGRRFVAYFQLKPLHAKIQQHALSCLIYQFLRDPNNQSTAGSTRRIMLLLNAPQILS